MLRRAGLFLGDGFDGGVEGREVVVYGWDARNDERLLAVERGIDFFAAVRAVT